MKTIHVVAAVIEENSRVFATQRGYGEFKDWWEFPGGKIEAGETPHLSMQCFHCRVKDGHLTLKEHEAAKWLNRAAIDSVKWLPADREVVNILKSGS